MAFMITTYAGSNVFIANTPRINPFYLANLQNQFKKNVKNIYLAFFSLNKLTVKKDMAVAESVTNNKDAMINFAVITLTPGADKTTAKIDFDKVDLSTIPINLFKYVSKGVSAYESGDRTVFRVEKGASYKVRKLKLSDGKIIDIIDFTGN